MHYYRRQEELKVGPIFISIRKEKGQEVLKAFFKAGRGLYSKMSSWLIMLQKLEDADDDSHLDSDWSDRQALKRQFQGLNNIKWGPR